MPALPCALPVPHFRIAHPYSFWVCCWRSSLHATAVHVDVACFDHVEQLFFSKIRVPLHVPRPRSTAAIAWSYVLWKQPIMAIQHRKWCATHTHTSKVLAESTTISSECSRRKLQWHRSSASVATNCTPIGPSSSSVTCIYDRVPIHLPTWQFVKAKHVLPITWLWHLWRVNEWNSTVQRKMGVYINV